MQLLIENDLLNVFFFFAMKQLYNDVIKSHVENICSVILDAICDCQDLSIKHVTSYRLSVSYGHTALNTVKSFDSIRNY